MRIAGLSQLDAGLGSVDIEGDTGNPAAALSDDMARKVQRVGSHDGDGNNSARECMSGLQHQRSAACAVGQVLSFLGLETVACMPNAGRKHVCRSFLKE